MRLLGEDGSAFKPSISASGFPELEGAPHDSNWLVIAGQVQLDGREWKFKALATSTESFTASFPFRHRLAATFPGER